MNNQITMANVQHARPRFEVFVPALYHSFLNIYVKTGPHIIMIMVRLYSHISRLKTKNYDIDMYT